MRTTSTPNEPPRMGLLAGWGKFPLEVAKALRRQGYAIYGLGIRDHADPQLAALCDEFRYVGIARIGAQIRYLRRRGVRQATMAGKIFKARLIYARNGWFWHFPDWRCIRTFYPHFVSRTRDRGDDTLMNAFIQAYAEDGIEFAPPTNFAPELLVKHGQLCGRSLTTAQIKDIAFGWKIAKEMGRLDIGQSVAVKGLVTIAVEAVEGTDACIRRAGELCPQGGFVLVKVAKPQQDMRFDVPTVGLGTIEMLVAAGGRVLAVEAGKTIIIDEPEVVRHAARHGLSIVAVEHGDAAALPCAA